MFTQDDADRALNAVATYLNCGTEHLRVVRGDEPQDMIMVQAVHESAQGSGAYIYQCSTGKVFPVNGFEDPETLLAIISQSRAEPLSSQ